MLQHRAIKSRASKRRNHTAAGILFALPWIIGFLAFSLYPIIMSVYYSLTDFNMFQTPKFVGLENYSALFQDEKFYKSLGNTLYMTVLGTPLCLCLLYTSNPEGKRTMPESWSFLSDTVEF